MSDSTVTRYGEAAARLVVRTFEDVKVHTPSMNNVGSTVINVFEWANRFGLHVSQSIRSILTMSTAKPPTRTITGFKPANEVGRRVEARHGGGIDFERYAGGFYPRPVGEQSSIERLPVEVQAASLQLLAAAPHIPLCQILPPPPPMLSTFHCCRP